MGKAVPKGIKSRSEIILEKFPEKFSADFSQNKKLLVELKVPASRKQVNFLAAYIGRMVKRKIEEKNPKPKKVKTEAKPEQTKTAGSTLLLGLVIESRVSGPKEFTADGSHVLFQPLPDFLINIGHYLAPSEAVLIENTTYLFLNLF